MPSAVVVWHRVPAGSSTRRDLAEGVPPGKANTTWGRPPSPRDGDKARRDPAVPGEAVWGRAVTFRGTKALLILLVLEPKNRGGVPRACCPPGLAQGFGRSCCCCC